MTIVEAAKRALATFVFGALSVPVSAAALDVDVFKTVLAAGIAAVLNFAYRAAEAYLAEIPEGE